MRSVRRLYRSHRRWAMMMLAMALAIRLLVPAGFMPVMASGDMLTLVMCNGMAPVTDAVPMKHGGRAMMHGDGAMMQGHGMMDGGAMDHGAHGDHRDHGENDVAGHHPCAFSGLSAPSLAATDPALLAAAIVFAFVFALLALPLPPLQRARHLRPPLRGPPLTL